MLATFSSKGEMLRLSYPNHDNRQYLKYFHTGVKVNDSNIIYLHDDINNTYIQYYDTDTNILNTEITNTYFNLKIVQTDFVTIKEDILVKKYSFINDSNIEQDIKFLIHSELLSDQNNFISGMKLDNGMVQFAHDFSIATFSKLEKIFAGQINGTSNNIGSGIIGGKDYVGMSKDSGISFDIGKLPAGHRKDIEICIYIDENKKTMHDFMDEVERIRKIDFNKGLIRYAADRFLEIELVTNTVTGLKVPLSSVVTKEFYKLPSEYLTTNDSQEVGVMIQKTDKNGNASKTFVKATIYGEDTQETDDNEKTSKSIYYIDMSNFKEGDVAVNPKDQSKYVIREVGVLEGTYCINQGYAVFRRILDQNEEYAVVSKETRYGLSRYDHIVRNADKVSEQEILY